MTARIFTIKSAASQTAEFLRDSIRSGQWVKHLPSERVLSLQLHVSRPTLRAALSELRASGHISGEAGQPIRILELPSAHQQIIKRAAVLVGKGIGSVNSYSSRLIDAVREQLLIKGIGVEIISSEKLHWKNVPGYLEDTVRQRSSYEWILYSQPNAVQRWFAEKSHRAVILGSPFPGVSVPFVDIDRRAICCHAIGVLARLGHRRICYFSRATNAAGDYLSEKAFEECRRAYKCVEIGIIRHDGTSKRMWNEARKWTKMGKVRPTAIIVSHAEDALSLAVELLRLGIGIPQEVSIISRNASPSFERVNPCIASYFFDPVRHARALCRIMSRGKISPQWLIPKFNAAGTVASAVII